MVMKEEDLKTKIGTLYEICRLLNKRIGKNMEAITGLAKLIEDGPKIDKFFVKEKQQYLH